MQEKLKHSILLGSIGGDSHSVGLYILKHALILNGYNVLYIGIQNKINDFYEVSNTVDAVLISNMDGHAKYYLSSFPEYKQKNTNKKTKWYLGGNPCLGDSNNSEITFLEMGFDRVFTRFIDIDVVLETIKKDLSCTPKLSHNLPNKIDDKIRSRDCTKDICEEKLELNYFYTVRKTILEQWKTGADARDLVKNAQVLFNQPNFALSQSNLIRTNKKVLIQPRCGVANVSEQIKLFNMFKIAGAGVLSYQVDSLTRNNDYSAVKEILSDQYSYKNGNNLNGFPVVNHGVPRLKEIIGNIKLPLQTRHSTRDPRLLAEISYAGGVTGFEGGPICYNIPYYKNYPLTEAIKNWQYVDRLTGIYYERFGILIDREFFGALTGTLMPPSLAIVSCLIESILAVQQGVRCISIGYAEQGNRYQDIAAFEAMKKIIPNYIKNLGYKNVQINYVFYQYMAAFPSIPTLAKKLIFNSAITAKLAKVNRILIKTPVEAIKIPSMRDNLHGINIVIDGLNKGNKLIVNRAKIDIELELILLEVNSIIEKVLMEGNGKIVPGIVSSFQKGIIDIPFSPSLYNRGKILTARDIEGAVRFLNFGNLPFDKHIKLFHKDRISNRRAKDNITNSTKDYALAQRDILQIARGQFETWPLSDCT